MFVIRSSLTFTSTVLHLHFMLDQSTITFVCRREDSKSESGSKLCKFHSTSVEICFYQSWWFTQLGMRYLISQFMSLQWLTISFNITVNQFSEITCFSSAFSVFHLIMSIHLLCQMHLSQTSGVAWLIAILLKSNCSRKGWQCAHWTPFHLPYTSCI